MFGEELRQGLHRGGARRIRRLPARRKLLGAQVPLARRVMGSAGRVSHYAQHDGAAPTWYEASARSHLDVACALNGMTCVRRRLRHRRRLYLGFPARSTSPSAAIAWSCLRRGASATAHPGRNGGQLGSGHRRDQPTLERELGEERARLLWSLAEEAKALVRDRVARHGIECDLKPGIAIAAHRPAPRTRPRSAKPPTFARQLRLRPYRGPGPRRPPRRGRVGGLSTEAFSTKVRRPPAPARLCARASPARRPKRGSISARGTPVTGLTTGAPCKVQVGPHTVTADAVVLACNSYLDALDPGFGHRRHADQQLHPGDGAVGR